MRDELQKAVKLQREGKLVEAHRIYDAMLGVDKEDAEALYLLGTLGIRTGELAQAVSFILKSIELGHTTADSYFTLSYCAHLLGWPDQAITALEKALELSPNDPFILTSLGQAHSALKQPEQARTHYEQALDKDPACWGAHLGLAVLEVEADNLEDAVAYLKQASEHLPELKEANTSPELIVQQLATRQEPYYRPRPRTNNKEELAERTPYRHLIKPKIRVLHQLSMSGASDVVKCLAAMNRVMVFNNIHPKGAIIPNYEVNIFTQANQWYDLFSKEEMEAIQGRQVTFTDAIGIIYEKAEQREEHMLLRDWSHLDFIAKPFLDEPTGKLTTAEVLQGLFTVKRACVVRHPIDMWLALAKLNVLQGALSMPEFLKCYLAFAKEAKEIGFIKFEDFCRKPNDTLKQLCDMLEITYDPEYAKHWQEVGVIASEYIDQFGEIRYPERPQTNEGMLEKFEAEFDYWTILETLGYEHPE